MGVIIIESQECYGSELLKFKMTSSIVISIIVLSFLLIKSADLVIVAIRRLSKNQKTKLFTISALILAVGTSFPELFVGITSALEGNPQVSLGTVTGSNIANISLVAGLTAFVVGRITVSGNYIKREVWIALVAGLLPTVLLFDSTLSRVDGFILLAVYLAYASSFFRLRFLQIGKEQAEEGFIYRFIRKFSHLDGERKKELGRLFIGIALMLFSADIIVRLATHLGETSGVPPFIIGLIVVAIGTSLPELAFSFRSIREHEPSMFFGNLLGSTIANSTLVLGLVAIIAPIHVIAVNKYFYAATAFFVVFITFWFFIRSKHKLQRWEGAVLILLYIGFIVAVIS